MDERKELMGWDSTNGISTPVAGHATIRDQRAWSGPDLWNVVEFVVEMVSNARTGVTIYRADLEEEDTSRRAGIHDHHT
ncbi:MAG: hypothetical protein LJE61_12410 [Thiocapsa sp.]|nr:hypothetical protein [Thiocapsa sp.]MCG6897955.1 hypothetical protein [Thiocapsa sp.]MCG6985986.1 hypothetical protein [Thiocapsa sp.]